MCRYQGSPYSLPESLVRFIMIVDARLDGTQQVSVLSTVAPRSESSETSHHNATNLFNNIKYEDYALIFLSFNMVQSQASIASPSNQFTLTANSSHYCSRSFYRSP